jgi:hypothetical protein
MKITGFLSYQDRPLGYKYCLYALVTNDYTVLDKELYFNKQDISDVIKLLHLINVNIDADCANFIYKDAHVIMLDEDDPSSVDWVNDSDSMDGSIRKFIAAIQNGEI